MVAQVGRPLVLRGDVSVLRPIGDVLLGLGSLEDLLLNLLDLPDFLLLVRRLIFGAVLTLASLHLHPV